MTEIIEKGKKARVKLLKGVTTLAEAVKVTLGPKGRTVLIRNSFGEIIITKDGVTVAKEIKLKDPLENIGAELVKSVSMRANQEAGDGTTTATVLAESLYILGLDLLDKGISPKELKKGIDKASLKVIEKIKSTAKKVKPESKELWHVAYIASNGNKGVADLLVGVYKDLGRDAVIFVEKGKGTKTTVKSVKGMQFDKGYLSSYCINDLRKRRAIMENPFIFLFSGKLRKPQHIGPIMKFAQEKGRPLLVIADDVKEEALKMLAYNHHEGRVESAIVQGPGFSNRRLELMQELAILTGGKVFTENNLSDGEQGYGPGALGEADNVEITNKGTVIAGGKGDPKEIQDHINYLRERIANVDEEDYDRKKLEESLAKLIGGISIIKVGGKSQTEISEFSDRIEDAKFATKAALEEGVVEGGGMSFLRQYMSGEFKDIVEHESPDFKEGVNCLIDTLMTPFRLIMENAGLKPSEIISQLKGPKQGYDAQEEKVVDNMFKAGIVDPLKVVRIALESAVSVVGTLLTTEYTIVNDPDSKLEF